MNGVGSLQSCVVQLGGSGILCGVFTSDVVTLIFFPILCLSFPICKSHDGFSDWVLAVEAFFIKNS